MGIFYVGECECLCYME